MNKDILFRFKDTPVKPEDFYALIEIEKGSKNKYEFDWNTGYLRLDRILYTSTHYPQNYGFIPNTYDDDGDPLDVLVIASEGINPLSLVRCKPIGVLKMIDGGKKDYKIIAVMFGDPFFNAFDDISELPIHIAEEIKHFFSVYKTLEGKVTDVENIDGKQASLEVIEGCMKAYDKRISKID